MLIWVPVHIRIHWALLQCQEACCWGESGSVEKMEFQKAFSWSCFHNFIELAHTSRVKMTA